MGRPAKPTALKKLAGNPGKRKLNAREPEFRSAPDGFQAPRGMKGEALAFWDRHYGMLQKSGVLKESDLPAFEVMCSAWGKYKEADVETSKPGGLIQETESGYQAPSGWVVLRGKFYLEWAKLAEHFGLTPSSRSKMKAEAPPEKDAFAEFLGNPVLGRIGA